MVSPSSPPLLEQYYWLSQIALAAIAIASGIIATFAVRVAFAQTRSTKLFELLKYTQDENFRRARRVVIREIGPMQDVEWWLDDHFEDAASTVCAMYDILGRLIKFDGYNKVGQFFVCNWADSIIRTHQILSRFVEARRSAGGNDSLGYEWLYQRALKFQPPVGPTWPPMKAPCN